MKRKTLWLVQTAMLIALLVTLQFVTKAGGQFVTGSAVNAVLAVSAVLFGLGSGVTVALLSPFVAYMLGIGPQLIYIISAIAIGNIIYVVLMYCLCKGKLLWHLVGWVVAAAVKCGTLYLLVSVLLCTVLPLKPPQIAMFQTMFSWPQFVTALIGGGIAMVIAPTIKKAIK